MSRVDKAALAFATVLVAGVMLAWYVVARQACDDRGGQLVRGALKPFTCVVPREPGPILRQRETGRGA